MIRPTSFFLAKQLVGLLDSATRMSSSALAACVVLFSLVATAPADDAEGGKGGATSADRGNETTSPDAGESADSSKSASASSASASSAAKIASSSSESSASAGVNRAAPLHEHPTLVRMWRRNNELRARAGLGPQRLNPSLTRAAQNHANYMARTGSFSHESNGGPLGRAQRYRFRGLVRENIAMGQITTREAFNSWQSSGGHWANICSDAETAGFGYQIDGAGRTYWVAVYGHATAEDNADEQAETAAASAADRPAEN